MNILAYRSGALGDTIVTLPALAALRRTYPGAKITLVAAHSTGSFLAGRSAVDAALSADVALWARYFLPSEGIELPPLPAQYDLAIVWSSDSGFCGRLQRQIPEVRQGSPMPRPGMGRASLQLAEILTAEERACLLPHPEISPAAADCTMAKEFYEQTTGHSSKNRPPLLVVHPGAGSVTKRWPVHCFQEVADFWRRRGGIVCTIIGPADTDIPPIGKTTEGIFAVRDADLSLIAGLLKISDYFLGNDSGIAHLADAVGCRGVVCFGPSDPLIWAPSSGRIVVFRKSGSLDNRPDVPVERVISQLSKMHTSVAREAGDLR